MRLQSWLTGACGALALVAIGAAGALMHVSGAAHRSALYMIESVQSVETAQRLHIGLLQVAEAPAAATREEQLAGLRADLLRARQLSQSPEEGRIVDRVERAVNQAAAELRHGGDRRALHEADAVLGELVDVNVAQAQRAVAQAALLSDRADAWALVGAGTLALVSALLLLWARERLVAPLAALRERMGRAATGEQGVRAPETAARELQEIAQTFNAMASLQEQHRRDRLELLGRVAAQLQAPLARLRGATGALGLGGERSAAPAQTVQGVAVRELERLSRILGEWLDAARLEEGSLPMALGPVDCRELLAEAVALFRSLSAVHRLELSLPASPLRVKGDGPRLAQVLHHLLALALREAPEGGRVQVAAAGDGRQATISVLVASGPSLGEPLFAALQMLEQALLGVPGAGFTLATSKKLIEAHGGRLLHERRGPAMLAMELTLPVLAEAAPPRPLLS